MGHLQYCTLYSAVALPPPLLLFSSFCNHNAELYSELTSIQTNKLAFGQSHAFKKSLMSSEIEKKKNKKNKRVGHHRKTLFKKLFGKFSRHGKYIILFVNKQNKLLKFPSAENIIFHNSFSICHSCSVKPHSV